jgi:hypothetical protein
MKPRTVFLALTVLGVFVPYFHFLPWLLENGLNLRRFIHELHANAVSEFFAADVFVSAAAVLALLIFERRLLGRLWWLPMVGLLTVGVSAALPMLLYLRQPAREPAGLRRGGGLPQ